MSKSIPIIADKKPIKVDLESGKNYFGAVVENHNSNHFVMDLILELTFLQ